MPTYVSELRRTKEAKKVKVEYKNTTLVEKIVIGSPVGTLRTAARTDLSIINAQDAFDSDGNALQGIANNTLRASQGLSEIKDGSILTFNDDASSGASYRGWRAKVVLDKQTINGGKF